MKYLILKEKDVYLKKIIEMQMAYNAIIIYGAGVYGKIVCEELTAQGLSVHGFCVSEKKNDLYMGKPVLSLSEVKQKYNDCLIVIAAKSPTCYAMLSSLKKEGLTNYVDIPRFNDQFFDEEFMRPILEITPKAGCRINCHYCPQDAFLNNYYSSSDVKEMSFEEFKTCIDKTPDDLMIDFSGFVEPFLAKDAIAMIQYAHSIGREMRLFTTLEGLNKEKFDLIKLIPFKFVMLHLPDMKQFANIPVTDSYLELLEYVMSTKKADGTWFVNEANCQCEPNERAYSIVRDKVKVTWDMIDRAGNLSNEELRKSGKKTGKLYCDRAVDLNHNVLLPNGDVVLCCMDFGLKYKLGNLLTDDYEVLFEGKTMQSLLANMDHNDGECICRQCTSGKVYAR